MWHIFPEKRVAIRLFFTLIPLILAGNAGMIEKIQQEKAEILEILKQKPCKKYHPEVFKIFKIKGKKCI